MTDPRYRSNAGCVYTLKYHLVWCSKFRRKVLAGKIADDLHNLLRKKAEDLEVTIEVLEIMLDHVHLLCRQTRPMPHNALRISLRDSLLEYFDRNTLN